MFQRAKFFGAALGGLFVLWWPGVALAAQYGAIAYSQASGRYGYSFNFGSRAAAEVQALANCGDGGCAIVVWFRNACGALATGTDNGYGYGWAYTRGQAESIAMANCANNASECSVVAWSCTAR
jgi:hypothetical protein